MDYSEYTLVQLRQMAKEKGCSNVSKLKKDELISYLEENTALSHDENEIKER